MYYTLRINSMKWNMRYLFGFLVPFPFPSPVWKTEIICFLSSRSMTCIENFNIPHTQGLPLPPVIKTGSQEWRRLKPVELKIHFFQMFLRWTNRNTVPQTSNLLLKNFSSGLDPLHANISMHILLTVLYVIPKVLTKRICLKNQELLIWWSFSLFSWS